MSKPMHKKNPFIVLVMVLVGLAAVGPLHAALALAAPSKTELVDILKVVDERQKNQRPGVHILPQHQADPECQGHTRHNRTVTINNCFKRR